MSAPQTNAASARSPIARIPAARPSSGPCSATASRATSTPSGSGGNSWPGAPTTTTGDAAAATARATWTTSGDPSQSRSAFGSPIRVDPPPASTIPPSRFAPVSVSRLARGAARASSRRSPARPRPRPGRSDPADDRSACRSCPDGTGGSEGAGASGMAGRRDASYRSDARPERTECVGAWRRRVGGVLGSATVTLSTRTRQAVPGFPTGPTSQCAPKSCLGVRSFHSFSAISTRISTGRLSGCETGFERVGEHLGGRRRSRRRRRTRRGCGSRRSGCGRRASPPGRAARGCPRRARRMRADRPRGCRAAPRRRGAPRADRRRTPRRRFETRG